MTTKAIKIGVGMLIVGAALVAALPMASAANLNSCSGSSSSSTWSTGAYESRGTLTCTYVINAGTGGVSYCFLSTTNYWETSDGAGNTDNGGSTSGQCGSIP